LSLNCVNGWELDMHCRRIPLNRKTSFEFKPQKVTKKRKTKKEMEKNDRGGSRSSGKDLTRSQGSR